MPPISPSALSPEKRERQDGKFQRRAIASSAMNPIVWRLPEYWGPGLPRPAKSRIRLSAYFFASGFLASPPAAGAAAPAAGAAAPSAGAAPSAAGFSSA